MGAPHRSLGAALAGLAAALSFPLPAAAHTGTGLPGGFLSGFMHPLTGFDHMLAMISVGLWGAFLGRPLIFALPVIFPTVMAVGAFLGMMNLPFPPVEVGIAVSVLVLGAAIAAAWRAPIWIACVIVAVFGLFHGYAHGKELPSAADPVGYSVGFVLSTGLLHVCGIGIGLINDRPGGTTITRSLGGLVALAGVFYLVTALLCAALGLLLGFAPRRAMIVALMAAAVIASVAATIRIPASWQDGVFLGLWASIAATAAAVHLPRGPGRVVSIVLGGNAGLWTGLVVAAAGTPLDLLKAAPGLLLCAPSSLLVGRGWGLGVKVAASWLIAVAILAASLTLVPTPGYKPDHMD
jgi:urease accessory protein